MSLKVSLDITEGFLHGVEVWTVQRKKHDQNTSLLEKANNCDPLSDNPAHPANNKFELEAILSERVLFQRKSVCCTVLGGPYTISY